MKIANVTANFPGILAEDGFIQKEAEATTIRSAISRAIAAILKSPQLKSKHLKVINFEVLISKKEV